MSILFVNSGTTNTRCYLIKDGCILQSAGVEAGSRNTALDGSNWRLIEAIQQVRDKVLTDAGICLEHVQAFYLSGMISSPGGLVEIPHLHTPVSRDVLRQSVFSYRDERLYHGEMRIIPGIKSAAPTIEGHPFDAEFINNMRGEEVEAFGALNQEMKIPSAILVFPGSHTQIVFVEDETIVNILSTVTGELYSALLQGTILTASIDRQNHDKLDTEMTLFGYDLLKRYGFNRAIYVVRTMDLFTRATPGQRASYLEGVLNGGVLDAIMQVRRENNYQRWPIVVCGSRRQYDCYQAIAGQYFAQQEVRHVSDDGMPFAVRGLLSLLQHQ